MELNKYYKILQIFFKNEICIYIILYSIMFILINFLSYLELKNKKISKRIRIVFYLIYLIIGTFGKLGTDYDNYKLILEKNIQLEPFYNLLNRVSFKNINIYYFLIMLLNIYFIETLRKKFNIKYIFFYISVFINFFFLDSLSIIRSIQAQFIIILGFIYIVSNRKVRGYFLILISTFFHKTAILNIFLLNFHFLKKIPKKKILLIFLLGIILNNIIYLLLKNILSGTKYIYYINIYGSFNITWWILNVIISLLKMYYLYKIIALYTDNKIFYKKYNILIKYSISGFILSIFLLSSIFQLSPYIFLRVLFIIFTVHLILLPKFQEYTLFNQKEYLRYLFISIIIYIINNIYIIRLIYARFLNKSF